MADVKARTKAQKAIDLRMAGFMWQDIATRLGYNSPQAACKAVHDLLKRTEKETAEQYRVIQLARLDSLLTTIWDKVIAGDVGSVLAALKIEDRRSKLLGLDAPTRITGTGESGEVLVKVVREDKRSPVLRE